MVDEIEPHELDKWLALAALDGWGEERQLAAMICATIHNSALRIVQSIPACGRPVDRDEVKTETDFLPKFARPIKTKQPDERANNAEPLDAWMRRITGVR